ncbi:hypothetical protein JCM16303_002337 [Sporobolomyces ruberrimus]
MTTLTDTRVPAVPPPQLEVSPTLAARSAEPSSPLPPLASSSPPNDEQALPSSSSLGYELPCPATVLHSQPSSPLLSTGSNSSFFALPGSPRSSSSGFSFQPRCHYRSQEMLEAAHINPGEARWECRQEQGGGLELVSPQRIKEMVMAKAMRDPNVGAIQAETPRATSPLPESTPLGPVETQTSATATLAAAT